MDNECPSRQLNERTLLVPREILRRKRGEGHNAFNRWLESELLHQDIFALVVGADNGPEKYFKDSKREFIGQEVRVFYRDN